MLAWSINDVHNLQAIYGEYIARTKCLVLVGFHPLRRCRYRWMGRQIDPCGTCNHSFRFIETFVVVFLNRFDIEVSNRNCYDESVYECNKKTNGIIRSI